MKATEFISDSRIYSGSALEKGRTSIPGNAAPAIRNLFEKGYITEDMQVLDYGGGKFARNANYLRENNVAVYSYDPFNGSNTSDGWTGVSITPPTGRFDVGFTSFVLNVVPSHIEDKILADVAKLSRIEYHITRNKDITVSIRAALLRKDKLVGEFFLTQFANDEEKMMYEEGNVPQNVVDEFVRHGVKTSKGFQRIPFLEEKGYTLMRNTNNFKIYTGQ